MNPVTQAKQTLRTHFRNARRSLRPAQQRRHAMALARHADTLLDAYSTRNIAVYLEFDGEIGTQYLIKHLQRRGKRIFVPVIADKEMTFASLSLLRLHQESPLKNPQAIPNRRTIAPAELDLVFMPLVAFDDNGVRLGLGGGFYDRCFGFKRNAPQRKPLLVGVAHRCQRAAFRALPKEQWDLRLDWRITESGLRKCLHRGG